MSKEIIVERGTKTVYRDGDTIVKQFKAGYPKSAVIKEAFNHALAEEVGLNVPELLEVKDDSHRHAGHAGAIQTPAMHLVVAGAVPQASAPAQGPTAVAGGRHGRGAGGAQRGVSEYVAVQSGI